MDSNNQRLVLALGVAVAILAGVGVAIFARGPANKVAAAPPASQGGLQVSIDENPASRDPQKKLRCFVEGQPVGEFTLAECAVKNGVSAQSLDVGLDESGALAAAPTASKAPPPALPPAAVQIMPATPAPSDRPIEAPSAPVAALAPADRGPVGLCLRYTGAEWRQVAADIPLNACVQALFAGRCVRVGEAEYGRWGSATLRLVPGKVEMANDNRNFRTVVEQRRGCESH